MKKNEREVIFLNIKITMKMKVKLLIEDSWVRYDFENLKYQTIFELNLIINIVTLFEYKSNI